MLVNENMERIPYHSNATEGQKIYQILSIEERNFSATRDWYDWFIHHTELTLSNCVCRDFSVLVVHKILVHFIIDSILESTKYGMWYIRIIFTFFEHFVFLESLFSFVLFSKCLSQIHPQIVFSKNVNLWKKPKSKIVSFDNFQSEPGFL